MPTLQEHLEECYGSTFFREVTLRAIRDAAYRFFHPLEDKRTVIGGFRFDKEDLLEQAVLGVRPEEDLARRIERSAIEYLQSQAQYTEAHHLVGGRPVLQRPDGTHAVLETRVQGTHAIVRLWEF